jgi:hypothetical protein
MTNDKDKKSTKESKADSDENENGEGSPQPAKPTEKDKKTDDKDPHRGITDTPPQKKEMLPDGEDPEDYFDNDGALDEELEDLDDEESDKGDEEKD